MIDGAVGHTYQFQGWYIRTAFVEGRAVLIKYSKIITKDVLPTIQDDELRAILAGEAGGGQWRPQSNASLNPATLLANSMVRPLDWINADYVARFGVAPEWNMAPLERQLADLEEALRLDRSMPEEPVDPDVLI